MAAARRPSQRSVSSQVKGEGAAAAGAARSERSQLGVCARVSASARAASSSGLRGYMSRACMRPRDLGFTGLGRRAALDPGGI